MRGRMSIQTGCVAGKWTPMEPVRVRAGENKQNWSKVYTPTRRIPVSGVGSSVGDCVWRRDWYSDLAMTKVPLPTVKTAVLSAVDFVPAAVDARQMLPAGVKPFQLNWPYILVIGAYHAAALLAFMPHYFSWSGLMVALLGTHLCGLFGINLCYHRLLTHRGLKCPKWLEHAMVIVAMSCFQETPARWVAIHRRHHPTPTSSRTRTARW